MVKEFGLFVFCVVFFLSKNECDEFGWRGGISREHKTSGLFPFVDRITTIRSVHKFVDEMKSSFVLSLCGFLLLHLARMVSRMTLLIGGGK